MTAPSRREREAIAALRAIYVQFGDAIRQTYDGRKLMARIALLVKEEPES